MALHSSTLAWKIPCTEEPGRLQSMGLQRVRHDWATSLSLFTFMHWRRKWQPTPVFLPGESQGRGSLVGCSPWGREESDTTEVTWQQQQQQVGPSQVPLSNHPCVDLEQRVKIINCRHHLWSGVSRLLHVIFFFFLFFFCPEWCLYPAWLSRGNFPSPLEVSAFGPAFLTFLSSSKLLYTQHFPQTRNLRSGYQKRHVGLEYPVPSPFHHRVMSSGVYLYPRWRCHDQWVIGCAF